MKKKLITVSIKRSSIKGEKDKWINYEVPMEEGMTVLGVLDYIYEYVDSSLAYYQSCRNGRCKGCWVVVNGKAVLSCKAIATDGMKISSLEKFALIRDLVVDFKKHVKTI